MLLFAATDPTVQNAPHDPYMVQTQGDRLAQVIPTLPPGAKAVGYVTDAAAGSTLDATLFDTAQYTLAPVLVERGREADWILGNFSTPAGEKAALTDPTLHLVRDLGNGVVIFRSEGR
jgi:hypothetical protein